MPCVNFIRKEDNTTISLTFVAEIKSNFATLKKGTKKYWS